MTPRRATVRALAAEAGLPTREALARLQADGFDVGHPRQRIEGGDLRRARVVLGLRGRPRAPSEPGRRLDDDELLVQMLRPLLVKGKVGRNHTTPIKNTWGRGVPDHQKDEARLLVERLIGEGHLATKTSQGRRHVWLTSNGRQRLRELEAAHATSQEPDA